MNDLPTASMEFTKSSAAKSNSTLNTLELTLQLHNRPLLRIELFLLLLHGRSPKLSSIVRT